MHTLRRMLIPIALFLLAIGIQLFLEPRLPENLEDSVFLNSIDNMLYIISITWGIIVGIRIAKKIILLRYDINEKDNLKSRKLYTQYNVLERILIFIIILFAIGTALMTFDSIRRIGVSLFASAGLAGIIIGLAAQKVIGTVLAGIQIALTQPIRIDDVLVVEGEWGWVEEITLTYVVVRIWDKRRLILPSTYFIENPFQNWTRVSADILGTVFIYSDYKIPVDEVRKELTRLLENTKLWDKKVNVLQVTNATEQTVELRALVSAKDSPTAWDLRVFIRENLIAFIQQNYPECLPKTRIELDKKSN